MAVMVDSDEMALEASEVVTTSDSKGTIIIGF
jgi:hypothetical protein